MMTLRYRSEDPGLSITTTRPSVIYEFGSSNGWFPTPRSPMIMIDLATTARKINNWEAVVDRAAKNEITASTRYNIPAAVPQDLPASEYPVKGISGTMTIEYTQAKKS